LADAAAYIKFWDDKCLTDWFENAKINSDRFFPTLLNKSKTP